jgi:hypothetical protein
LIRQKYYFSSPQSQTHAFAVENASNVLKPVIHLTHEKKYRFFDIFRVLGSLLLLILLGAFLAFSSLGAGSNERTRTPLGAHQQRF